jgi:hypothetical protein
MLSGTAFPARTGVNLAKPKLDAARFFELPARVHKRAVSIRFGQEIHANM